MCQEHGLHQVDLLIPAKIKITDKEYRLQQSGQKKLDKINQEIIIRPSHLQKTLTAGNVMEERRGITPNTVRRAHIDRSIEQPSGPFGFFRRIRSTVGKTCD